MKKVSMKIAMAAILLAVGTLGINAQNGQGGSRTGTGTGTCICATGTCTTQLTDEQKVILEGLCEVFQAEMTVLSAAMLSTTVLAEKLAIRSEMTVLRNEHFAEVKALLKEWGIVVNTGTRKGSSKKIQSGNKSGTCIG